MTLADADREASDSERDALPIAAEGPVLDRATLDELKELGPEVFEDLARLFLGDGAERVAAMREAARAGDMRAIEGLAHSLKGSTSTFGAKALADICAKLQVAASLGQLPTALKLIDAVGAGFDLAGSALHAELEVGSRHDLED